MRDNLKIITLDGVWSIARRDELAALLEPAYETKEPVIIDLQRAEYADSSVLAALIVLRNRRRAKGLPLPLLVIGSKQVLRLFTIAGLEQAFEIFETLEQARRAAQP